MVVDLPGVAKRRSSAERTSHGESPRETQGLRCCRGGEFLHDPHFGPPTRANADPEPRCAMSPRAKVWLGLPNCKLADASLVAQGIRRVKHHISAWVTGKPSTWTNKKPIGFDYVHAAVDDHTPARLRRGTRRERRHRGRVPRARCGVRRRVRHRSDRASDHGQCVRLLALRRIPRRDRRDRRAGRTAEVHQATPRPWQNGRVEPFNRTPATEWAYREPFDSKQARANALAPWLRFCNTERIHSSHGLTPAARVSPTRLLSARPRPRRRRHHVGNAGWSARHRSTRYLAA